METRYNSDASRVSKKLQQMTDQGRYILNVPGLGENPAYILDPQIRAQGWAGNLRTNMFELENELRGINRPLSRDCLGKDEFQRFTHRSQPISYPTNDANFTEQPRSTHPAWEVRDTEQALWQFPPLNPQENTCISFLNNISTRILEKDYYIAKVPCNLSNDHTALPTAVMTQSNISDSNSFQRVR